MNPVIHDANEPDHDRELFDSLNAVVPASLGAAPTDPRTRTQLMDLLTCPKAPVDRSAYAWSEVAPGIKLHVVSEDSARGVKRCLVWGVPGAVSPRHGHSGDEVILVLEGHLRDERAAYGPGEICRSHAGDVHQEQVVGETDCVCFVVYYGELIPCS
jgi:anti-sigma factor ChrR (cupin superfamily)